MTVKLKLGPLPKTELVKLTLAFDANLKRDLDRYAELYAQTNGEQTGLALLIPYMLEAFLKSDRGFRQAGKLKLHVQPVSPQAEIISPKEKP